MKHRRGSAVKNGPLSEIYGRKVMMSTKAVRATENTMRETRSGMVFYANEFEQNPGVEVPHRKPDFNPIGRNLADLVSAKQTVMAKLLAGRNGLDENDIADHLFGCDFSELSKTAAGLLIEYLEDRAVNLKTPLRLAG